MWIVDSISLHLLIVEHSLIFYFFEPSPTIKWRFTHPTAILWLQDCVIAKQLVNVSTFKTDHLVHLPRTTELLTGSFSCLFVCLSVCLSVCLFVCSWFCWHAGSRWAGYCCHGQWNTAVVSHCILLWLIAVEYYSFLYIVTYETHPVPWYNPVSFVFLKRKCFGSRGIK